ncbi:MAG TPA: hypothetical protein VN457_03565, partial [Chlamydiales bacterium]|nr:hypothetical protein [Chlamydiales bacterium]
MQPTLNNKSNKPSGFDLPISLQMGPDLVNTVTDIALKALDAELRPVGGIPQSEQTLWKAHLNATMGNWTSSKLKQATQNLTEACQNKPSASALFFEKMNPELRASFFTSPSSVISNILRKFNGDIDAITGPLKEMIVQVKDQIKELDLQDCPIKPEHLEKLFAVFKNLRSLNLNNCQLTEKSVLTSLMHPAVHCSIAGHQNLTQADTKAIQSLIQFQELSLLEARKQMANKRLEILSQDLGF